MRIDVTRFRNVMAEMLDPFIIDKLRQHEEQRQRRSERDRVIHREPPAPPLPVGGPPASPPTERGVVTVDFTLESLVRSYIREAVKTIDDVRTEKPLPGGLTVPKLKEIFKSVPYEAQEVKKKFAQLGFNVKWSRWNDRDGDKLAGECFTEDGMRYFFEFHDLDPQVGRDHPLLVMFDNSGSSGWVQDDDGYLAKAKRTRRHSSKKGGADAQA